VNALLVLLRRSGTVPNSESVAVPGLQRTTSQALVLRCARDSAYHAARSGNAAASPARLAAITPRSVISPVTSRAGVTSKP